MSKEWQCCLVVPYRVVMLFGLGCLMLFGLTKLPIKTSNSSTSLSDIQNRNLLFTTENCHSNWWFEHGCMCDEASIQTIISSATPDILTDITLCRNSHIMVTTTFDISSKVISIRCSMFLSTIFSSKCSFDGLHRNRIFTGNNAQLILRDVDFINGNATFMESSASSLLEYDHTSDGGALLLENSNITIVSCIFNNNTARNGAGSAIMASKGTVVIQDSTFLNNGANDGGAIALKNVSNIVIQSSHFWNNFANAAGAIIFNDCDGSIDSTDFISNSATSIFGGAIAMFNSQLKLIQSTFAGNHMISGQLSMLNDIAIFDDGQPGFGGSFLDCDITLFCDGLNGISELNDDIHRNTNCFVNGYVGSPSDGKCPN